MTGIAPSDGAPLPWRIMKTTLAVFVVAMGLGTAGCSSVRGDCETVCNWVDDCGGDPESDCVDDCVADYDDADDACQEAFDEFAACLEEDDSCGEGSDCVSEFNEFAADCADDID
jgi:hypothetical protein